MESLLKHIKRAYEVVVIEHQKNLLAMGANDSSSGSSEGKTKKDGWWTTFIRGLIDTSSMTEEETSAEDIRKTVMHLETAQRQLCGIFNVSDALLVMLGEQKVQVTGESEEVKV